MGPDGHAGHMRHEIEPEPGTPCERPTPRGPAGYVRACGPAILCRATIPINDLTWASRLGAHAHPPRLPVYGQAARLAGAARSERGRGRDVLMTMA